MRRYARSLGFFSSLTPIVVLLAAASSSCGKDGGGSGSSGATSNAGSDAGASAGASGDGAGGSASGGVAGVGGAAGSSGASLGGGGSGGVDADASAGGNDAGAVQGPPFGHPSPAVTHPTYPGFTLWLVEDFDAPLDLDTDPIWTWSDGGFQTQRFVRDAITFSPGKMTITMTEVPQAGSCSYSSQGIVSDFPRTSGELRTRHNLFRYGRYEARIKAPSVRQNDPVINGNYIASFFMFRTPACQDWREIDLEVVGNSPSTLFTNVIHSDDNCATTEIPQDFNLAGFNFRTGFVTIGFEWLPINPADGGAGRTVRYYYLNDAGAEVTLRTETDARVPELSAKIMANLWVFKEGYYFGGPEGANNQYPFHSEYDFIRFYKWDGEDKYPCAAMDESCLEPTDLDLTSNNACDGIPIVGDFSECMGCGETVHTPCTATCTP